MTTTKEESVPSEGPSKNELKKLAKKAEKAAKKAGTKGTPTGTAVTATTTSVPVHTPHQQNQPVSTQPTVDASNTTKASLAYTKPRVRLANLTIPSSSNSNNKGNSGTASLKVVWAAQLYRIDVQAAKSKDVPACAATLFANKPCLLYGDQVVSGGGNAMAQTMAYMTTPRSTHDHRRSTAQHGLTESLVLDDWCEWERTVLRPATTGTVPDHEAAFDTLTEALRVSPTGIHIVGHQDSVADVCILATLLQDLSAETLAHVHQKHPLIATYLDAHRDAVEAARVQLAALVASVGTTKPPQQVDTNEPSLNKLVESIFQNVVYDLFPDAELPTQQHLVSKCQNPKHGDYQCNAAMPVFAALKKDSSMPDNIRSPPDVARALMAAIGDTHPVIMELSMNGPGFVLCRIRPSFLETHVDRFLQTGILPKPLIPKQTCVVDFSSPNIAKEMHVGHLRSTIIGEAVCRILEFVGHDVHRINHVGDWGTQFGMLIQYLKEEYPEVANHNSDVDDQAALPNITDLTQFYKSAKARFDESADFKKTSQTNVVALQSGDPECLRIWKLLCDVSRQEFEKVYQRLDVTTHEFGESFYNAKIPPVIAEFEAAGKISVEEGGAKCVFVDKFKVPLMLQKSDGGYGYDSTDMAALKYRLQELKADRIIVITDFSQGDHFKMVYAAGRDIGWLDRNQQLEHIGFGTVQGEDGKRFKTRSGDTVRLVDLLDEAVERMEGSLRERIESDKSNIALDEVHDIAEAIGYGAVKYYDLRRNPTTNYKFSYDQMLDTKGDTGVYLLYARVRLESIVAKAKQDYSIDVEELIQNGEKVRLTHPSERNLVFQLQQFPDVIEQTLEDLFPYHVCEYVYKLAVATSDFIKNCMVLGSDEMKTRLLLCHATSLAMHQCFDLLGIRHVKRI
jgi:arginyl-tRNA synthetase